MSGRPAKHLRRWLLLRMQFAPFEAAIALLIVTQASLSLLRLGVLNPSEALLPAWLNTAVNVAYLLSGMLIITGLLITRGDVEGAGLVLLACTILARGVVLARIIASAQPVAATTTVVFSLAIATACVLRLTMLRGPRRRGRL